MNRRSFFGTLFGAAAIAADPERLLWVPGKKLISIPRTYTIVASTWESEFNQRYPLIAPFTVIASRPADKPCAEILNKMARIKWNEDPAFRDISEKMRILESMIVGISCAQLRTEGWANSPYPPLKVGDRLTFGKPA